MSSHTKCIYMCIRVYTHTKTYAVEASIKRAQHRTGWGSHTRSLTEITGGLAQCSRSLCANANRDRNQGLFLPEPGLAPGPDPFPSGTIRLQLRLYAIGLLGLPHFQGPKASCISLPLCFSTQLVPQTQWTINNEHSSFLRLQPHLSVSFILMLGAFPLL